MQSRDVNARVTTPPPSSGKGQHDLQRVSLPSPKSGLNNAPEDAVGEGRPRSQLDRTQDVPSPSELLAPFSQNLHVSINNAARELLRTENPCSIRRFAGLGREQYHTPQNTARIVRGDQAVVVRTAG